MGGGPITVIWRGITTDPESARCWEAAATDPELDDILIRPIPGYGSYRDNAASGGTDNGGGHVDLNFVGLTDAQCRRVETVYRRYGNLAFWRPERRPDGTRYGWQNHGHVLRIDCADLSDAARTQLGDYRAGYNGLPIGGRINKDTGDRRYLAARWLTIKQQLEEDDMPLSDDDVERVAKRARDLILGDRYPDATKSTPAGAKIEEHIFNANAKAGRVEHIVKRIEAALDPDAFIAKVIDGVAAEVNGSTGSLTTDQLKAATEAGVRAALGSLDNTPEA